MQTAAALTMVRDDEFFLKAWLRHYGGLFGRENCFVINHGRGTRVAELAEGCNIIGLPYEPDPSFDMRRWRLLNGLVTGLRNYYRFVIVGDVDELVVLDPKTGTDLKSYLAEARRNRVLTPLGLEVIHRIDCEPEPVGAEIIGPRRFVRPSMEYSKPCVVAAATKISRGGHFSRYDRLFAPDPLYLFHLKYCDFDVYSQVMDHRNAVADEAGGPPRDSAIGRHWYAKERGKDRAVFEGFQALEMRDGFPVNRLRRRMHKTWGPRGDTGFWEFDRKEHQIQFRLPDRFIGAF